jgi:hypothetical protein
LSFWYRSISSPFETALAFLSGLAYRRRLGITTERTARVDFTDPNGHSADSGTRFVVDLPPCHLGPRWRRKIG